MGTEQSRCPSCGALAGADAEWCGQCFASLVQAPPMAKVSEAAVGGSHGGPEVATEGRDVTGAEPAWPCSTCDHRNPIELNFCEVCGTAFATLMRGETSLARPAVDPRTAAARSLAFPGLGHRLLGRGGEALTRAILFAWTFGTAAAVFLSRLGKGLGPAAPIVLLYGGAALVVYTLSALDAYRVAEGDRPIVSSRALLWATVGLVVLSALFAVFAVAGLAGRR